MAYENGGTVCFPLVKNADGGRYTGTICGTSKSGDHLLIQGSVLTYGDHPDDGSDINIAGLNADTIKFMDAYSEVIKDRRICLPFETLIHQSTYLRKALADAARSESFGDGCVWLQYPDLREADKFCMSASGKLETRPEFMVLGIAPVFLIEKACLRAYNGSCDYIVCIEKTSDNRKSSLFESLA